MFFDDQPTPFRPNRQRYQGAMKKIKFKPVKRVFSLDPFNEFDPGDAVAFDTECYRNYWLASFKHLKSGKYFYLEQRGEGPFTHGGTLSRALWFFKVVSFKGETYDLPMVAAAIEGATTEELKERSDEIIKEGKTYFNANPGYNHIDLWDVAPLPETSLKTYGARIHTKRLQELPIEPDAILSIQDMDDTRDYCFNDNDLTGELFDYMAGPMKLRESLSAEYKIDLRSKSDAQIAEAVIGSEYKKLTGYYPKRPEFDEDFEFKYVPPSYVKFKRQNLQDALNTVINSTFKLDKGGSPQMPEGIAKLKIPLGASVYKMGMGGLHSTEKSKTHHADEVYCLIDRDVASFYPFLILNNGYFPEHLGPQFLTILRTIVERRLSAKDAAKECKKLGDTEGAITWAITSDGLKITINGSFGKLGSQYSILYSPKLMIQVTVTGQLLLLMLIEAVEDLGMDVISANTDGIIIKCPHSRVAELNAVVAEWERTTDLETEETRYKTVASRDVNSYLAVKLKQDPITKEWTDELDGVVDSKFRDEQLGVKSKGSGVYCERGSALNSPLSKNPEYLVLNDAIVDFIATGKKPEETIRACHDIRRFIAVKNVRGGGHQDGQYLGKVVRWYFANGQFSAINYVGSGNQVGGTNGAKPLMELPDEMPDDVNRDWYIAKAYETIDKLGFYGGHTQQAALFN